MIKIFNALNKHERIFFILHQAISSNVLIWENDKILIRAPQKLEDPYIQDKKLMHIKKFSNTITESIDDILKEFNRISNNLFVNIKFKENYELIKTNYDVNFKISFDNCFIYLPQTNEMVYYNKNFVDRNFLISHAYVIIMPFDFSTPGRT